MNWKHTRTGKMYQIIAFAIDENSMRPVVVYAESGKPDAVWTRPCEEFFDGRFQQLGEKVPNFGPGAQGGAVEIDVPGLVGERGAEAIARRDSVAVRPKAGIDGGDA